MKNTFKTTMKRKLFFFIATLLISGRIDAQENHYQFNYHLFEHSMPIVTQIKIDGVEQTSSDIELGSFNGDMVTGSERIGQYGSAGYYRAYMAVFFNEPYEVSFKIYNHSTGEEMDNCEITYLGEPYNLVLNDDGLGTNKKPLVLNFLTTSTQTFTKEIVGYGNSNGGYYFIASPIDDVNSTEISGMTTGDFDLYRFNQSADLEWENWKQEEGDHYHFNLELGRGYLYANMNGVTLNFTGTPIEGPTYEVSLVKDDDAQFPGWNLVGNPFAEHTAYIDRDCFVMNTDGRTEIIASDTRSIEALEGAFVIATENDESLTFSTSAPAKGSLVSINLNKGRSVMDRAIVRFGEGRQLPKFQLRNNSTKVYIPIDGQDFAVVRSEGIGEMPISFKAEENGTYTISINAEEVEFNYLHLIDNMTGADVDLLQIPNYSFEANVTDYESRFKLVFVCGDANDDNGFAFYSNGSFIINNDGDATLQVVDMTGRIVKSETINGSANIDINAAPGVYMLRLVNGDNVKTQKIVVG